MKLDSLDWKILNELQENARAPLSSLSKKVGLSSPALSERIKRLEEAQVITAYRAIIDPRKVGYDVMVILRLRVDGPRIKPLLKALDNIPEILECHRVTGEDCYIVKMVVQSLAHLDSAVVGIAGLADAVTSVVLASPVEPRAVPEPK